MYSDFSRQKMEMFWCTLGWFLGLSGWGRSLVNVSFLLLQSWGCWEIDWQIFNLTHVFRRTTMRSFRWSARVWASSVNLALPGALQQRGQAQCLTLCISWIAHVLWELSVLDLCPPPGDDCVHKSQVLPLNSSVSLASNWPSLGFCFLICKIG